MGCGSQQTVESSGFVASDLEQSTQINVEGVEKQSFNNIAESQVEITPKQQKLLNIARKLKSQINFTEFYQLRSQMISFSNVCPVVPERMLNFEEEIKAQNLKLSKQAADGQPKFIFSTTSVADAPDYNKVDKTDTQSATQVQRTQQHLEEVKKCTIDKKQLRLFQKGKYQCETTAEERELYSKEIKACTFINQSNVAYSQQIITGRLIGVVATGVSSLDLTFGCPLGQETILAVYEQAVIVAQKSADCVFKNVRISTSSITFGNQKKIEVYLKASEILSSIIPTFEKSNKTNCYSNYQNLQYDLIQFNSKALIKFIPNSYRHHTNFCTKDQLKIVQLVISAVEFLQTKITFNSPISQESYNIIMKCILNDFPEIFFPMSSSYSVCNNMVVSIQLNYQDSKEHILDLQKQLSEIKEQILAPIQQRLPDISVFDSELIITDYLVSSITYDLSSQHNQQIEGALIDKRCVCAGYARAFFYLSLQLNIPCVYVVGYAQPNGSTKGEPHAWNKLLIDNKWVTLDPTWTAKGEEGYAYFNFDDKLASKSRKEENDMKYPAALSMDLFYYKVKQMYVDERTISSIEKLTQQDVDIDLKAGKKEFQVTMYFSVANVIPLNYCDQQKSGIVKATKANGLVIESISNSSSGNVLMSKVMLNEKIKIEVQESLPNYDTMLFKSQLRNKRNIKFNKLSIIEFKPEYYRHRLDQLNDVQFSAVQDIISSFEQGLVSVVLSSACSQGDLEIILDCVEYDFFECMYNFNVQLMWKNGQGQITQIQFTALPNETQIKNNQSKLNQIMNDFKKIAKTQNMSEQDVEFLVATWIANNTSSQKQSQLPYTAYGLFIDKAYNWVGAAEAFTYTMQYFGIPCITVTTQDSYYNLVYIQNQWRTVILGEKVEPHYINTIDSCNIHLRQGKYFKFPKTTDNSMNYAAKLNILISKDMEDNLRQIVANRVSILMKESNVFDAIFCFDYKADIAKLCDVAFQGVFDANSKVNSVGAEFTSSQLIIHVK